MSHNEYTDKLEMYIHVVLNMNVADLKAEHERVTAMSPKKNSREFRLQLIEDTAAKRAIARIKA